MDNHSHDEHLMLTHDAKTEAAQFAKTVKTARGYQQTKNYRLNSRHRGASPRQARNKTNKQGDTEMKPPRYAKPEHNPHTQWPLSPNEFMPQDDDGRLIDLVVKVVYKKLGNTTAVIVDGEIIGYVTGGHSISPNVHSREGWVESDKHGHSLSSPFGHRPLVHSQRCSAALSIMNRPAVEFYRQSLQQQGEQK